MSDRGYKSERTRDRSVRNYENMLSRRPRRDSSGSDSWEGTYNSRARSYSSDDEVSIEERPLELDDDQIEEVARELENLKYEDAIANTSPPGTGKSYTTMGVCIDLGKWPFIMCVPAAISHWVTLLTAHKMPYHDVVSYTELRGYSTHSTSQYLVMDHGEYIVTSTFDDMMRSENGMVMVIDESQEIRNPDVLQTRAVLALVRHIEEYNNTGDDGGPVEQSKRCKIIVLSATIGEKTKHELSVIKSLGIVTCDSLYGKGKGRDKCRGIYQLIDWANEREREITEEIYDRHVQVNKRGEEYLDASACNKIMSDIYEEVLKEHCISGMPDFEAECIMYNAYLNMDDVDVKDIEEGMKLIEGAYKDAAEEESYKRKGDALSRVREGLFKVHSGMIPKTIEMIDGILNNNRRAKILIFAKRKRHMEEIHNALCRRYSSVIVNSKINKGKGERDKIIRKFQEDSSRLQIIVTGCKIFDRAVSLHDLHGGRPRYVIGFPSYEAGDAYQANRRVLRKFLKSVPRILMIHCQQFPELGNMLSIMINKSMKIQQMSHRDSNTIYPHQYQRYDEPEDGIDYETF